MEHGIGIDGRAAKFIEQICNLRLQAFVLDSRQVARDTRLGHKQNEVKTCARPARFAKLIRLGGMPALRCPRTVIA